MSSRLGSQLPRGLLAAALGEGEVVECVGRLCGWVTLHGGAVTLPLTMLARFGVEIGDRPLVVRGSGLAVGFAARGPLVREAERHAGLGVFEPDAC